MISPSQGNLGRQKWMRIFFLLLFSLLMACQAHAHTHTPTNSHLSRATTHQRWRRRSSKWNRRAKEPNPLARPGQASGPHPCPWPAWVAERLRPLVGCCRQRGYLPANHRRPGLLLQLIFLARALVPSAGVGQLSSVGLPLFEHLPFSLLTRILSVHPFHPSSEPA